MKPMATAIAIHATTWTMIAFFPVVSLSISGGFAGTTSSSLSASAAAVHPGGTSFAAASCLDLFNLFFFDRRELGESRVASDQRGEMFFIFAWSAPCRCLMQVTRPLLPAQASGARPTFDEAQRQSARRSVRLRGWRPRRVRDGRLEIARQRQLPESPERNDLMRRYEFFRSDACRRHHDIGRGLAHHRQRVLGRGFGLLVCDGRLGKRLRSGHVHFRIRRKSFRFCAAGSGFGCSFRIRRCQRGWLGVRVPELRIGGCEFQIREARLSLGGRFDDLAQNFSVVLLVVDENRLANGEPGTQIQHRAIFEDQRRRRVLGEKLAFARLVGSLRPLEDDRNLQGLCWATRAASGIAFRPAGWNL